MAARGDLPFPLLILCLVLIRRSSPLPTASTHPIRPQGATSPDPLPDDYSQYEDTSPSPDRVSTHGGTLKHCDYNPCLSGQVPCNKLASCLCPGLTSHNVAPEAPPLRSVSWNGSEVVIRWCAPNSYVTSYIVTVAGQVRKQFEKGQRSGALGTIENISEVCVIAVNEAGASDGSCMMSPPRDSSLVLKAGLIGGALGFLLLLLLAVLLWRHRRQRKQQASISMHDTTGTQ